MMSDITKKQSTISIRAIKTQFNENTERYWFGGNPFTTHLLNTLSFQFPSGEENFVRSVQEYKDQITDPGLKKDIRGFVGQELLHGQIHDQFNRWVAERTPNAERYCDEIALKAEQRYEKAKKSLPLLNLGATVALEHLTAVMSSALLQRPELIEKMHPEVRPLLVWHAIEEIEHKSVAYDVYQTVSGSYWTRIFTYLLAIATLTIQTSLYQFRLLRSDRQLGNFRALAEYIKITLGFRRGFFTALIIPCLKYLSPRFHPSQTDDDHLIAEWNDKLSDLTEVRINGRRVAQTRTKVGA